MCNEADKIENTVEKIILVFRDITSYFEIIIAEDGSTDGTDKISKALAKKYTFVKHLHSDKRQGRGRALTRAFDISKGKILAYIDVDLATDMKHFNTLLMSVYNGCDFTTGSRMLPESNVVREFKRGFASRGFNFLVRQLLGSKLYDHQCGFKAFKRESYLKVIDSVKDTHWFWDTELYVKAQQMGFKVNEFPVDWKHSGVTKVNLLKDSYQMGSQIFRMWREKP